MISTQREMILIVEDDVGVARLQRRQLERAGYCVDTVTTGADALTRVRKSRVDLLILDFRLPDQMTGLDVHVQLKAEGEDIPVILVTGFSDEQVAIQALRAGVRDFVSKSVEYLEYLPLAVERVLGEIRTRNALKQSERRFQAFMDNSPAIAFLKDEAGRMLYANAVLERQFQWSRNDWYDKADTELWPPDVAQTLRENDLRVLIEKRTLEFVEQLPSPHDGKIHHWLSFKFPVHSDGGDRLIGGMAIDVTGRMETEESLRSLQDQFRQAQKMEAIGRLAGGVAHDFNNLLTVILGYSDMMLEDLGPQHPLRTDIEEIHHAAQRSSALTRQLLTFSRQHVFSPQVLDLNETVSNVEKLLRRLIGDDVMLQTVLDAEQSHIVADVSQVEQVIVNLAVNARDAMPEGGRLIVETGDLECDEAFSTSQLNMASGRYVMLAVSDTGHGMDQETQARIFEPFFTTKEVGRGTGLGLSTVYGIVTQSGGQIFVQSEIGQGTTFKVYFPAAPESAEERRAKSQTDGLLTGSEVVLLVDDHDGVRALAQRILSENGYRVLEARDPAEAISCAAHSGKPVDLLITDVVMLGRSGPELADRLRSTYSELKVLFMSGYAGELLLQRQFDSRREPFLQKPFSSESLLRSVREILDAPAAENSPETTETSLNPVKEQCVNQPERASAPATLK